MVMSASTSRSSRMRQYRRKVKKTKVFSGFTSQLKEVLGRLLAERQSQEALPDPCCPGLSPAGPYSLGLLQGLRLFPSFAHWPLLCLLYSQQLKLCLYLPLGKDT